MLIPQRPISALERPIKYPSRRKRLWILDLDLGFGWPERYGEFSFSETFRPARFVFSRLALLKQPTLVGQPSEPNRLDAVFSGARSSRVGLTFGPGQSLMHGVAPH